jgi:hypothetical protein
VSLLALLPTKNIRIGLYINVIDDRICALTGNLKPHFVLYHKDFGSERSLFALSIKSGRRFLSDALICCLVDGAPQKPDFLDFGITHCMRNALVAYLIAGSYKGAAELIGIKPETIKDHLASIRVKLGVNNNAHAAALFMKYGWISDAELTPPLQIQEI